MSRISSQKRKIRNFLKGNDRRPPHLVTGTVYTHLLYTVPINVGVRFRANDEKVPNSLKTNEKCAACVETGTE